MNTVIIVGTQFEGIHCYPNAPEEVSFLRSPHRHVFHVKAEIEVFHEDRELEFILVKRSIEHFVNYNEQFSKNASCEMMADTILRFLEEKYPRPDNGKRQVKVTVMEDNENGAYVTNY